MRDSPAPVLTKEKRLTIEANVANPRVIVSWPAPRDGEPESAGVNLMARALKGTLHHQLVERRELAIDTDWYYDDQFLGGMVHIAATLKRLEHADEAVRVLDLINFDWSNNWRSMTGRQSDEIVGLVLAFESFLERARIYARDDDFHRNPLFFARRVQQWQSVDTPDVFAARDNVFRKNGRLVTLVKPNPAAPIGGRIVDVQ